MRTRFLRPVICVCPFNDEIVPEIARKSTRHFDKDIRSNCRSPLSLTFRNLVGTSCASFWKMHDPFKYSDEVQFSQDFSEQLLIFQMRSPSPRPSVYQRLKGHSVREQLNPLVGRSRYAEQVRCPVPRCNTHGHVVNSGGLIVQHISSKELPHDAIEQCQPGVRAALRQGDELFLVCNPETSKKLPPLGKLEQLSQTPLIHCNLDPAGWGTCLAAAKTSFHESQNWLDLDSRSLVLEAAAGGLGLAIGRLPYVTNYLNNGRLVEPYSIRVDTGKGYYLVYPEHHASYDTVMSLRTWLLDECKAKPALTATAQLSQRRVASNQEFSRLRE